ncbi:hypothetical protein Gasu2_25850 [Galdieria sulphuraria]|uniref:DNA-directed RNA polymerase I subunit RPA43 n=1 Tax=Galdieria sulphuraria TaxID=130081 RepID=M2VZW2_GALSU|nr:uncharacterized protein Gasu_36250 [Galdieria sulphuraria]EME28886.1 hypothetical protein Gasu_36250 [Galdieria sulphuraria]GJD08275.1 hypothetical protein Gasu2_25850 [Galdieria sulphuraria]|eukprot:XP_005705406.1 hypothetical protein Gasu_36250 [Galdieria sulphuraria]
MFLVVPCQVTTLIPPWLLDPIKGPYWVKTCFQELLSDAVLGYEPSLGGVILAYGNIRLPENAVTWVDYTPFGKVTCQVKVLLFPLKPGQRLIGRVVFVGEDQVSLQVFGVFPAVITVDNGLSDYAILDAVDAVSTDGKSEWRQEAVEDHREKIGIGSWLRFEILQVQLGASERLFLLHGTLKETREQLTGEEKLGLLDEDQVRESFSLPSKVQSKRKGRRRSNIFKQERTPREKEPFSFEYSSLGDPLLDDPTLKTVVHHYFADHSPEEEEEEEEVDRDHEDTRISPTKTTMESIGCSTKDSTSERKKKHSKKDKKHERKRKKKHKKEKRKRKEEEDKRNRKKRRKHSK